MDLRGGAILLQRKIDPGSSGEDPEVEIRPLFDPADFDVPGEAEERAKRLGEKLGKA